MMMKSDSRVHVSDTRVASRVSRCFATFLALSFAALSHTGFAAGVMPTRGTVLGVNGARWTLNGTNTFLLGFSYYGGLGAPEDFVRQDLRDFRAAGFNWLRVWATWNGYETNLSAVTSEGLAREPFLSRLKWMVAECDRLGMVVDVTLNRGQELPDLQAHLRAVQTLVGALKSYRNWYLDLANEHDVRDARHVSVDELKELRARVRRLDPHRLVTASFGGHDLSLKDVHNALEIVGVDFLCPHRPRHRGSAAETEAQTRETLHLMREAGRVVPVHYQEPFRRGYADWEPTAADFLADLRGALRGGAAGWCFHNGGQRSQRDEQPRRSFDLRTKRLMDQLDEEESKVVKGAQSVVFEYRKGQR